MHDARDACWLRGITQRHHTPARAWVMDVDLGAAADGRPADSRAMNEALTSNKNLFGLAWLYYTTQRTALHYRYWLPSGSLRGESPSELGRCYGVWKTSTNLAA